MRFSRLWCVPLAAAGLATCASGLQGNTSQATEEWLVYIGTYSSETSRGIYLARFDGRNGKLGPATLAAEMTSPSFLATHPTKPWLYAVSERWDAEEPEGSVHAFEIDRRTGALKPLGAQSSAGRGPCHLAVDGKGRTVLVANYGSGSVAALRIGNRGELAAPESIIQHRGSSVNPSRQTGPHAHQILPDPANRRALVCDLGLDKVLVYELASRNPWLRPNLPYGVPVKPGSGPRHLAFAPDGRWVYVLNELDCTIDVFAYNSKRGILSPVETVSTLPPGFKEENTCAEIAVHPSGKFVYASNRGHNSLAVYSRDPISGRLTLLECQSTQGRTPRHFAIAPGGNWLLAQNQDSDNIVVFGIDRTTGRLLPTGTQQQVGKPVCLLFVRPETAPQATRRLSTTSTRSRG